MIDEMLVANIFVELIELFWQKLNLIQLKTWRVCH